MAFNFVAASSQRVYFTGVTTFTGANGISICFRMKQMNTSTTAQGVVSIRDGSGNAVIAVTADANSTIGSFQVACNLSGGSNLIVRYPMVTSNVSGSRVISTWNDFEVCWDGTRFAAGVRVYKNGALLTQTTSQDGTAGQTARDGNVIQIGFGGTIASPSGYFNGQLGSFGFWNSALTAGNALSIAQGALPPTIGTIVEYIPLIANPYSFGSNVTGTSTATQGAYLKGLGPQASYAAQGYGIKSPSTGARVGVASAPFLVFIDGTHAGVTITPASNKAGTFSPTSVALSTGTQVAAFTYTPAETGTHSISVSSGGALTDPAAVNFYATTLTDFYFAAAGNGGSNSNAGTAISPWLNTAVFTVTNPVLRGVTYNFLGGDTFASTYLSIEDQHDGQDTAGAIVFKTTGGVGQAAFANTGDRYAWLFTAYNSGGITLSNVSFAGAGTGSTSSNNRDVQLMTDYAGFQASYYNYNVSSCTIKNGQFGLVLAPRGPLGVPKMNTINILSNTFTAIWNRGLLQTASQSGFPFGATTEYFTITGLNSTWTQGLTITGNTFTAIDDPNNGVTNLCCAASWTFSTNTLFNLNLIHDVANSLTGNAAGNGAFCSGSNVNTVMESNEVYNIFRPTLGDGLGLNLDSGSNGCTVQYNYVHDCDGGGLVCYEYLSASRPPDNGTWVNNTFRFNIVAECGVDAFGAIWLYGQGMNGCVFYNNTIAQSSVVAGTAMIGLDDTTHSATDITNFSFINNTVLAASTNVMVLYWPANSGVTQPTFTKNNLYPIGTNKLNTLGVLNSSVAAWQAAQPSFRSGNISTDPALTDPFNPPAINDPSNLDSLTAYDVTSGAAPGVDTGQNLSATYTITQDFKGNFAIVGGLADIGAITYDSTPYNPPGPVGPASSGGSASRGAPMVTMLFPHTRERNLGWRQR